MTQVPHSQRPVDAPVVSESASTTESPAAASTAPATPARGLPDELHNALTLVIYRVGIPLYAAGAAVDAIAAHPELLDALITWRQQQQTICVRADLDALPVGTVILDYYGFAWQKSKYQAGHPWRRADGSSSEMNFCRDLPERVLWAPRDTKRETDA